MPPLNPATADAVPRLLLFCSSTRINELQQACALVVSLGQTSQLEAVRALLVNASDRAGRQSTLSALVSFLGAVASAICQFTHRPLIQTIAATVVTLALLKWATRASHRQSAVDTALDALCVLPITGPLSRETIERLCPDRAERPPELLDLTAGPLYRAHLALARAAAIQQRRSRR
jgi:hypothetical protein